MTSWKELTNNGKKTFIIAEIGKNQIKTEEERSVEEYLKNAKELVKLAKESGADAVKFQTHWVHDEQLNIDVTSPHFKGADRYSWVTRNTKSTPFHEFWLPLKKYCDEIGIMFFSTPMSKGAAWILNQLNVPIWKVGSGDLLDFPTLEFMSKTKKPIVFSTGMSTWEETQKAIDFLRRNHADIAMLHCISKYPAPPEDLHLATIEFYKEQFPDLTIGFSDHSIGYESAVAAVALGAQIIEKHFSTDRTHWGADHKVSMHPDEFRTMVNSIRELELNPSKKQEWLSKDIVKRGMGEKKKTMLEGEAVFRQYFRKSLMAGQSIKAGTVITEDMVYAMRPQIYAKGLPSERYEEVIGKIVTKDLNKYDPITFDILK